MKNMYRYPNYTMYNVTEKKNEGKRIGSPKKIEKEAKRAQLGIQTLASSVNKKFARRYTKKTVYIFEF